MKLRRMGVGLSMSVLFAATGTLGGVPAPEDMKVSKLSPGVTLAKLPKITPYGDDPQNPQTGMPGFYFSKGQQIRFKDSLEPSTIKVSTDSRLQAGNASCSFYVERKELPESLHVIERPTTGSKTFSFSSGKTVILQQAVFRTGSNESVICYKVSPNAITVRDLKLALGSAVQINLSDSQASALQSMEKMRKLLAGAGQSAGSPLDSGSPTVSSDSSAVKNAPAPKPEGDVLVDESTSGNFKDAPVKGTSVK